MMFWVVSTLACSIFSRFSIDQTCCSNNRKCDKNFGYNLLGSISARLMLDWSNMFFDRLNLIFDRSKFVLWVFKKVLHSCVLHTIHIFSKFHWLVLFDRSILSQIFHFLPQISQGFWSSIACKSLLPFLFQFIHILHAF